jgi:hypothetical protein
MIQLGKGLKRRNEWFTLQRDPLRAAQVWSGGKVRLETGRMITMELSRVSWGFREELLAA